MKATEYATKVFFVIKEKSPVQNVTKRIKQILDEIYKKIT